MLMRARHVPWLLTLSWIAACGPVPERYDSYEAGLVQAVDRVVAALEERPDTSVVVPTLRHTDGTLSELGRVVADDLTIFLSRSGSQADTCTRTGFDEFFRELELESRGIVVPDGVHELGRVCGADTLLLGTLFIEGDGMMIRLLLVDTETQVALTGERFWVPLTRSERQAMERQVDTEPTDVPTHGNGRKRQVQEDNLPQHRVIGDFKLTLLSCEFVQDDGLFCLLNAKNRLLVDRPLTILGTSSILLDNQGEKYSALGYRESEEGPPSVFDAASSRVILDVPGSSMHRIELHFDVRRREKKAQLLQIETPDGTVRFEDFFFDRD